MILAFIATMLIVLALGQAASMLGIWFRYAIPRAPKVFHWLLLFPMLLSILSALGLAWVILTGDEFVGLDTLMLFLIYCGSQAIVYWVLVFYSVWWWTKGRRCPV